MQEVHIMYDSWVAHGRRRGHCHGWPVLVVFFVFVRYPRLVWAFWQCFHFGIIALLAIDDIFRPSMSP